MRKFLLTLSLIATTFVSAVEIVVSAVETIVKFGIANYNRVIPYTAMLFILTNDSMVALTVYLVSIHLLVLLILAILFNVGKKYITLEERPVVMFIEMTVFTILLMLKAYVYSSMITGTCAVLLYIKLFKSIDDTITDIF